MAERVESPVSFSAGREEESLFARDDHDVLVRREQETRERFKEMVTVTIDGYPVVMPRAVPKTDAQGNAVRGPDGELVPRTTTIFDAAAGLVSSQAWSEGDLKSRIPTLCHQPHLPPVGVCRTCSVHVSSMKRGKLTPGRRLVPACQHRVEKDMVVTTRAGADGYNPANRAGANLEMIGRFAKGVNASVRVLAELLAADHLRPSLTSVKRYDHELADVVELLGVAPRPWIAKQPGENYSRNAIHRDDVRSRKVSLPLAPTVPEHEGLRDPQAEQAWAAWNSGVDSTYPYSSRSVVVDHDRCILCDRCVRSCSEVRPFKVLGHSGKGYQTRVSFDLDRVMGESNCVQCGECMVSCPTAPLSLRRRVQPRNWPDSPELIPLNPNTAFSSDSGFLSADEMLDVWLAYNSPRRGPRIVYPFRAIPYAYLKWNEGSVRRWVIPAGQQRMLYKEGEYGSTAFLLQGSGLFLLFSGWTDREGQPSKGGWLSQWFGKAPAKSAAGKKERELIALYSGDQLVLGESSCLTHQKRKESVLAEADPNNPALELVTDSAGRQVARVVPDAKPVAVVYEVTRNLLEMMQRGPSLREDLEEVLTARTIELSVRHGELSRDLPEQTRQQLAAFLLKSGRLEFRRVAPGQVILAQGEAVHDFYLISVGTVRVFRVVAGRERVIDKRSSGEYFGAIGLLANELRKLGVLRGAATGRLSSVAAVDPVDLVRVPGEVFREMCARFPDLHERLLDESAQRVEATEQGPPGGILHDYVQQGLFQAQRLLALDLVSCTRCDECTRACADSHDGHSRLLREGLRFGDFLVAASCRSCHKPYCMEGCPVDSIHRREGGLEVVIESHCIGCGLCEKNCPYGAIQMVSRSGSTEPGARVAAPRRAVNCDLCDGGEPFCVQACPHEAAFRMDGPALLAEVSARMRRGELP